MSENEFESEKKPEFKTSLSLCFSLWFLVPITFQLSNSLYQSFKELYSLKGYVGLQAS